MPLCSPKTCILAPLLAVACSRDPYPPLSHDRLEKAEFRAQVEGYVPAGDGSSSRRLNLIADGERFSIPFRGRWRASGPERGFDCHEASHWVPGAQGWICHQVHVPSERDSIFKGEDSLRLRLKDWGAPAVDTGAPKLLRLVDPEAYSAMLALQARREAASDSVARLLDTVKQILRQKASPASARRDSGSS